MFLLFKNYFFRYRKYLSAHIKIKLFFYAGPQCCEAAEVAEDAEASEEGKSGEGPGGEGA